MSTKKAFDLATVAVFVIAVGVPVYGLFFRIPGPLDENRNRFAPPQITADRYVHYEFTKHFELYLGDYIGYRDVLLGWHRQITYGLFHEPVTNNAWIGKEGWYYLNQNDPFRGNPKYPTPSARAELWVEALAARDAWFKSQGIEYIVVIAPDKAAVYPEYLKGFPQRHPPLEMGTPVSEKLNARGVTCLNLLPLLREAKERTDRLLYFKTDSHWNHDGARAGYWAIAEAIRKRFPDFTPHPESDYTFGSLPAGDLRKSAGIRDDVLSEESRKYFPRTPIAIRETEEYFTPAQAAERLAHAPSEVAVNPAANGPRMLFLHDSFGGYLRPFFYSDFQQVSSIGTYGIPMEALRIVKPKLVVQLIVARQLYSLTPKNPPEIPALPR